MQQGAGEQRARGGEAAEWLWVAGQQQAHYTMHATTTLNMHGSVLQCAARSIPFVDVMAFPLWMSWQCSGAHTRPGCCAAQMSEAPAAASMRLAWCLTHRSALQQHGAGALTQSKAKRKAAAAPAAAGQKASKRAAHQPSPPPHQPSPPPRQPDSQEKGGGGEGAETAAAEGSAGGEHGAGEAATAASPPPTKHKAAAQRKPAASRKARKGAAGKQLHPLIMPAAKQLPGFTPPDLSDPAVKAAGACAWGLCGSWHVQLVTACWAARPYS